MKGGRRTQIDARRLLMTLESEETENVWRKLWDELHRQGDVGESSYACVPHLVRIYRQHSLVDWNTYAIVGIIALARTSGSNPALPRWLERPYHSAIQELAAI